MKRHMFAAGLALAVVAVLGFARPAAAQQVPFNGRLEGVLTSRTPLAPPFVFEQVETLTGNATYLGKYNLVILSTVNLKTLTATGSYHFVAANGDRLTATFVGRGMPTEMPGVVAIVETATITGGTGRFAGASGRFICERLYSPATGRSAGSFSGTISRPGP
jgi:hypothetical protein